MHPDAESMGLHLQVAAQHISGSYTEYLDETVSIQVFGEPTDEVLATMRRLAPDGVPLSSNRAFAGFNRLPQATATR